MLFLDMIDQQNLKICVLDCKNQANQILIYGRQIVLGFIVI